jgi:hypothetical protein
MVWTSVQHPPIVRARVLLRNYNKFWLILPEATAIGV